MKSWEDKSYRKMARGNKMPINNESDLDNKT